MALEKTLSSFFDTIASTSAFESVRKVQKVDANELGRRLQTAKASDLGTPVFDYVELTLYKDLVDEPAKANTGLAYSSTTFKDKVSAIGNAVKQGIARQQYLHGINEKTLHLNNVEVVVNQTNNIVRTAINGLSGTFKEFYSDGDLIITLTGSLIGSIPFQNDIQNLNNFTRIYLQHERFNIKSDFINNHLATFDVIMSDFTMTLSKEYNNVVDYQITLEADKELNIIY